MSIVNHDKPQGDPGALGTQAAWFQNTADSALTGGGGETGTFSSVRDMTSDWKGPASETFRTTVDGYNQACADLSGVFDRFAGAIRQYQSDLQGAIDEWNRGEGLQATVNSLVSSFQHDFDNRDGWERINRSTNDIFDPGSNLLYWIKNDQTDSRLPGDVHADASNLYSTIQSMWTAYDNANTMVRDARTRAIAAFNDIQASAITAKLGPLSTPLSMPGALNPQAGDPVPLSQAQSVTITVEPGDNLTTIARKYYGTDDWHVVYDNNPDFAKQFPNPNLIFPGATLVLANTVKGQWSPAPVTLSPKNTVPFTPPPPPQLDSTPPSPTTTQPKPAGWSSSDGTDGNKQAVVHDAVTTSVADGKPVTITGPDGTTYTITHVDPSDPNADGGSWTFQLQSSTDQPGQATFFVEGAGADDAAESLAGFIGH
jgi:hypothetical protein